MTAAELYAMEKAKHGVVIPRAEGCPRKRTVTVKVMEGRKTQRTRTEVRYRRWVQMYTEGEMTSPEIAAVEGVSHTSVWRALKQMGMPMRTKGWKHTVSKMTSRIEQLEKENRILRSRLIWARRREAA